MLNAKRSIRASDIRTVQTTLGLSLRDMMYVLGCVPTSYYKLIAPAADGELPSSKKDLPIIQKMILRTLLLYGADVSLVDTRPTLNEFRVFVEGINPKWAEQCWRFSVLLGRERTAAFRWFGKSSADNESSTTVPVPLRRWMRIIWLILRQTPVSKRAAKLEMLYTSVIQEAALSGYDPEVLRKNGKYCDAQVVQQGIIAKRLSAQQAKTRKVRNKPKTKG